MFAREPLSFAPPPVPPQAGEGQNCVRAIFNIHRVFVVLASNVGGTATLIGDPPNIMIASYAHLSFMDFLKVDAPIAIIAMVARDIMSTDVIAVHLEDTVERVTHLMMQHRYGALPVVAEVTRKILEYDIDSTPVVRAGKIVGIVSPSDWVEAVVHPSLGGGQR